MSKRASVWLVELCIPYEGRMVEGIYATKQEADSWIEAQSLSARTDLEATEWLMSETDRPSDAELLRRVVMDYGDKCCDDHQNCSCSMAQSARRVNGV